MARNAIELENAPAKAPPLSPAIRAGGFVFISGQASVDEQGQVVHDTFANEMKRSMANLQAVLAAAGLTMDDVVQVTSYVGSQENLVEYNQMYVEYFSKPYPARTTLIGCLGTVVKFEIDAVACEREADASR